MPVHVIFSDLVRNPLKAEAVDQPVIQRRGISPVDCGTQVLIGKLLDQVERTGQTADLVNQASGMIDGRGVEIDLVCRRPHLNLTCGAAGDHRLQISDTSLRWTLARRF